MNASPAHPHLELITAPSATAALGVAADLAAQPAARAVRVVALARLADATRGYEQMVAGQAEGLHDLRVALRRVRTLLRAFRPLVEDTLKKKTLRALRSLARASSEARDAEVAAAWVTAQTNVLPRAGSGMRETTHRLTEERDAALAALQKRLERDLPGLVSRLGKQLSTYLDAQTVDEPVVAETFGDAATAVIDRQKARLARALARVKTVRSVDEAHRARIAAKRLRYVLEPLHDGPETYAPLARLIELQDSLGAARDAHQLARRFVREVGELAARDARGRALVAAGVKRADEKRTPFRRVRPGLIELARRAHVEELRAFAAFRQTWGKRHAASILATIP